MDKPTNPYKMLGFAALVAVAVIIGCDEQGGASQGKAAPDVQVQTLNGNAKVALSSLKGKVVVLDFWATWCGPCKETMPMVQKAFDDYKSQGVEFMGISAEAPSDVKQFLQGGKFSYPMYIDPEGEANKGFKVDAIPHLFVLGKDGKVVWDELGEPDDGGAALRTAIDKALKS